MSDEADKPAKVGKRKPNRKRQEGPKSYRPGVFPEGQKGGNKVDPKTVYQPRFTFDDWEAEDTRKKTVSAAVIRSAVEAKELRKARP